MARIRTIKPEFFTDEELAALPPLTRIAFVGLWTQADKAGRLEDRPARLKVTILPYDKVDFGALLDELVSAGFIIRYAAQGRRLIQIRSFLKHQRPHHTEPESTLPPCEDGETTVRAPLDNGVTPDCREGKGKEGNGREGSVLPLVAPSAKTRRAERGSRLPDPFDFTPEREAFAREGGLTDVELLFGAFKDWHRSKGSVMLDWEAAWRSWCRKELDIRSERARRFAR